MFNQKKHINEENAIVVENVSKHFKIPLEKKNTLFENMIGTFESKKQRYKKFTALKNISFSVKKGETLGIIGENGSGKSTLLKIIAGVLTPDTGSVKVYGKIAPFLELGVGFQPELTAEENVRLYGAVMGLKKDEIEEKFDEIFEFAELEKFKNMKLKNFSSGMYMRLAFATAVATDPDILLIDEVLAVGDEAFQSICFNKIDEFKSHGKTIVFVSHDMQAIKKLCKMTVFLENGQIKFFDNTENVIYFYHSYLNEKENRYFKKSVTKRDDISEKNKERYGTKDIEIIDVKLLNKNNEEISVFHTKDIMKIVLNYKINKKIKNPIFGIGIYSNNGTYITGIHTKHDMIKLEPKRKHGFLTLKFNNLPLLSGIYKITVGVCQDGNWKKPCDVIVQRYIFKVESSKEYDGFVELSHVWET